MSDDNLGEERAAGISREPTSSNFEKSNLSGEQGSHSGGGGGALFFAVLERIWLLLKEEMSEEERRCK